MSEHKTLVEVQHLQQYFPAGGVGKNRKYVQAVDDVSFSLQAGETLGTVGKVTGYYTVEGTNVYFAMEQDGKPVNPMDQVLDI